MFGRHIKKIISIMLLAAFTLQYSLSDAQALFVPSEVSGRSMQELDLYEELDIPSSLGRVEYSMVPEDARRVVIHVQDAHCNYNAQKAICALLSFIFERCGVGVVNLEGGAGAYDLSPFIRIKDPDSRLAIAGHFMREGTLSAGEYFGITNPDELELWGVEDAELYYRNLGVYRSFLDDKKNALRIARTLERALNEHKVSIYSEEMLKLDRNYARYKRGNKPLRDYLTYIERISKEAGMTLEGYPNLGGLFDTVRREGDIDFKMADIERDELFDLIRKDISSNGLEMLIVLMAGYKRGEISSDEFYERVFDIARFLRIDMTKFPNLTGYVSYREVFASVDKIAIFDELKGLEKELRDQLARTELERELAAISRAVTLAGSLFEVKLTPGDHRELRDEKELLSARSIAEFLTRAGSRDENVSRLEGELELFEAYLGEMSRFYEYAFKRDEVFLDNMKFSKCASGVESAILVTGGFHTTNLARIARDRGMAFISVIPSFGHDETMHNPYHDLLAGRPVGLQGILDAAMSTIQIANILNPVLSPDRERFALSMEIIKAAMEENVPHCLIELQGGGEYLKVRWHEGTLDVARVPQGKILSDARVFRIAQEGGEWTLVEGEPDRDIGRKKTVSEEVSLFRRVLRYFFTRSRKFLSNRRLRSLFIVTAACLLVPALSGSAVLYAEEAVMGVEEFLGNMDSVKGFSFMKEGPFAEEIIREDVRSLSTVDGVRDGIIENVLRSGHVAFFQEFFIPDHLVMAIWGVLVAVGAFLLVRYLYRQQADIKGLVLSSLAGAVSVGAITAIFGLETVLAGIVIAMISGYLIAITETRQQVRTDQHDLTGQQDRSRREDKKAAKALFDEIGEMKGLRPEDLSVRDLKRLRTVYDHINTREFPTEVFLALKVLSSKNIIETVDHLEKAVSCIKDIGDDYLFKAVDVIMTVTETGILRTIDDLESVMQLVGDSSGDKGDVKDVKVEALKTLVETGVVNNSNLEKVRPFFNMIDEIKDPDPAFAVLTALAATGVLTADNLEEVQSSLVGTGRLEKAEPAFEVLKHLVNNRVIKTLKDLEEIKVFFELIDEKKQILQKNAYRSLKIFSRREQIAGKLGSGGIISLFSYVFGSIDDGNTLQDPFRPLSFLARKGDIAANLENVKKIYGRLIRSDRPYDCLWYLEYMSSESPSGEALSKLDLTASNTEDLIELFNAVDEIEHDDHARKGVSVLQHLAYNGDLDSENLQYFARFLRHYDEGTFNIVCTPRKHTSVEGILYSLLWDQFLENGENTEESVTEYILHELPERIDVLDRSLLECLHNAGGATLSYLLLDHMDLIERLSVVSRGLDLEQTKHHEEPHLSEDEKTSVLSYILTGKEDTIERALKVWERFFSEASYKYGMSLDLLIEILEGFHIDDLSDFSFLLKSVMKKPAKARETNFVGRSLGARAERRGSPWTDRKKRRAGWIFYNIAILGDSAERIKKVIGLFRENFSEKADGEQLEFFVTILKDLHSSTPKNVLTILKEHELDQDKDLTKALLDLKLESSSQERREEMIIAIINKIDKLEDDEEGSLQDTLSEWTKEAFHSQPSESRVRIYMAVLAGEYTHQTDDKALYELLESIAKDRKLSIDNDHMRRAGEFLEENREALRAHVKVVVFGSEDLKLELKEEKDRSERPVFECFRSVYRDREARGKRSLRKGLQETIGYLQSRIEITEPRKQLPHVFFDPLLKLGATDEQLEKLRLLFCLIDRNIEGRTVYLKRTFLQEITAFAGSEGTRDEKKKVFAEIFRSLNDEYPDLGDEDRTKSFHEDLIVLLRDCRNILSYANMETAWEDELHVLAEDIIESMIAQRNEPREIRNKIIAFKQTASRGELADFKREMKAHVPEPGIWEPIEKYWHNRDGLQWFDHNQDNMLSLISRYLDPKHSDEVFRNAVEAFSKYCEGRNEESGAFQTWRYSSNDYTATLDAIIDIEAERIFGEDGIEDFRNAIGPANGDTRYEKLQNISVDRLPDTKTGAKIERLRDRMKKVRFWEKLLERSDDSSERIVFTDEFIHLFTIGHSEHFESCQSCAYNNAVLRTGLMGYVCNGTNKAIALLDEHDRVVTRRIVRLRIIERELLDGEIEKIPVIYVEAKDTYNTKRIGELYEVLEEVSARTGLPVYLSQMPDSIGFDRAQSFSGEVRIYPGRSSYDYSDSAVPLDKRVVGGYDLYEYATGSEEEFTTAKLEGGFLLPAPGPRARDDQAGSQYKRAINTRLREEYPNGISGLTAGTLMKIVFRDLKSPDNIEDNISVVSRELEMIGADPETISEITGIISNPEEEVSRSTLIGKKHEVGEVLAYSGVLAVKLGEDQLEELTILPGYPRAPPADDIPEHAEQEYKEVVKRILSEEIVADVPFYVFKELFDDLFGLAHFVEKDSPHNLIALHSSVSQHPVAIFHEIVEYLMLRKKLSFELNKGWLKVSLNGDDITPEGGIHVQFVMERMMREGELWAREGSVQLTDSLVKDHYLLRIFQRAVFRRLDEELTVQLKVRQKKSFDEEGLRDLASEKGVSVSSLTDRLGDDLPGTADRLAYEALAEMLKAGAIDESSIGEVEELLELIRHEYLAGEGIGPYRALRDMAAVGAVTSENIGKVKELFSRGADSRVTVQRARFQVISDLAGAGCITPDNMVLSDEGGKVKGVKGLVSFLMRTNYPEMAYESLGALARSGVVGDEDIQRVHEIYREIFHKPGPVEAERSERNVFRLLGELAEVCSGEDQKKFFFSLDILEDLVFETPVLPQLESAFSGFLVLAEELSENAVEAPFLDHELVKRLASLRNVGVKEVFESFTKLLASGVINSADEAEKYIGMIDENASTQYLQAVAEVASSRFGTDSLENVDEYLEGLGALPGREEEYELIGAMARAGVLTERTRPLIKTFIAESRDSIRTRYGSPLAYSPFIKLIEHGIVGPQNVGCAIELLELIRVRTAPGSVSAYQALKRLVEECRTSEEGTIEVDMGILGDIASSAFRGEDITEAYELLTRMREEGILTPLSWDVVRELFASPGPPHADILKRLGIPDEPEVIELADRGNNPTCLRSYFFSMLIRRADRKAPYGELKPGELFFRLGTEEEELKGRPDGTGILATERVEIPLLKGEDISDTRWWVFGRTLVIEEEDGFYAFKIMKEGETREDLEREHKAIDAFSRKKARLGIESHIPEPVFLGPDRQRSASMVPDALHEDILKAISEQETADGKYSVDQGAEDVSPQLTYMCYKVEDAGFFVYLNECGEDGVQTEKSFLESSLRGLRDLARMAREGVVSVALVDLFHNLEDDRRYLWMADRWNPLSRPGQIHPGKEYPTTGPGRMDAWERALMYPNLRESGIADFGEFMSIDEVIGNGILTDGLLRDGDRLAALASFMGEYLLSWTIIYGDRLKREGLLDKGSWEDKEFVEHLANNVKNVFTEVFTVFIAGSDPSAQDQKLIADLRGMEEAIDWERMARQMAFFMGGAYREHIERGDIPVGPGGIYPEGIPIAYPRDVSQQRGWGLIDIDKVIGGSLREKEVDSKKIAKTLTGIRRSRYLKLTTEGGTVLRIVGLDDEALESFRDWLDEDVADDVIAKLEEYRQGWRNDGVHEDLGPVNGPNPLTELMKALYYYGVMGTVYYHERARPQKDDDGLDPEMGSRDTSLPAVLPPADIPSLSVEKEGPALWLHIPGVGDVPLAGSNEPYISNLEGVLEGIRDAKKAEEDERMLRTEYGLKETAEDSQVSSLLDRELFEMLFSKDAAREELERSLDSMVLAKLERGQLYELDLETRRKVYEIVFRTAKIWPGARPGQRMAFPEYIAFFLGEYFGTVKFPADADLDFNVLDKETFQQKCPSYLELCSAFYCLDKGKIYVDGSRISGFSDMLATLLHEAPHAVSHMIADLPPGERFPDGLDTILLIEGIAVDFSIYALESIYDRTAASGGYGLDLILAQHLRHLSMERRLHYPAGYAVVRAFRQASDVKWSYLAELLCHSAADPNITIYHLIENMDRGIAVIGSLRRDREGQGQIGKDTVGRVAEKNVAGNLVISVSDREGFPLGKVEAIRMDKTKVLESSIAQAKEVEKERNELSGKIVRGVIELFQSSKAQVHEFDELLGDFFGGAFRDHDSIAVHSSISGNFSALFHEMGHYLLDLGEGFSIKKEGAHMEVRGLPSGPVGLFLSEETLKRIAKEGWHPGKVSEEHYLLRILQMELFPEEDQELSRIIADQKAPEHEEEQSLLCHIERLSLSREEDEVRQKLSSEARLRRINRCLKAAAKFKEKALAYMEAGEYDKAAICALRAKDGYSAVASRSPSEEAAEEALYVERLLVRINQLARSEAMRSHYPDRVEELYRIQLSTIADIYVSLAEKVMESPDSTFEECMEIVSENPGLGVLEARQRAEIHEKVRRFSFAQDKVEASYAVLEGVYAVEELNEASRRILELMEWRADEGNAEFFHEAREEFREIFLEGRDGKASGLELMKDLFEGGIEELESNHPEYMIFKTGPASLKLLTDPDTIARLHGRRKVRAVFREGMERGLPKEELRERILSRTAEFTSAFYPNYHGEFVAYLMDGIFVYLDHEAFIECYTSGYGELLENYLHRLFGKVFSELERKEISEQMWRSEEGRKVLGRLRDICSTLEDMVRKRATLIYYELEEEDKEKRFERAVWEASAHVGAILQFIPVFSGSEEQMDKKHDRLRAFTEVWAGEIVERGIQDELCFAGDMQSNANVSGFVNWRGPLIVVPTGVSEIRAERVHRHEVQHVLSEQLWGGEVVRGIPLPDKTQLLSAGHGPQDEREDMQALLETVETAMDYVSGTNFVSRPSGILIPVRGVLEVEAYLARLSAELTKGLKGEGFRFSDLKVRFYDPETLRGVPEDTESARRWIAFLPEQRRDLLTALPRRMLGIAEDDELPEELPVKCVLSSEMSTESYVSPWLFVSLGLALLETQRMDGSPEKKAKVARRLENFLSATAENGQDIRKAFRDLGLDKFLEELFAGEMVIHLRKIVPHDFGAFRAKLEYEMEIMTSL